MIRVFPYAAANFVFFEKYREALQASPSTAGLGKTGTNLVAGSAAGVSAGGQLCGGTCVWRMGYVHVWTLAKMAACLMLCGAWSLFY